MEAIHLIRPVLVKVKVTEAYKRSAAAQVQEALQRIELELQHLDFQERRLGPELEKKNPQGLAVALQRLEQERSRRKEKRQQLLDQLKGIGQLAEGTEVLFSKMESPVELKPGDEWSKVLGVEIIIQDGIVAEIRQGGAGKDHGYE
ncbi:MAG: YlqD family protein [Desulfotomaculaceae bacterium]|nr:YlqD family protein [Desulfotomaculaceae bacterium]